MDKRNSSKHLTQQEVQYLYNCNIQIILKYAKHVGFEN